LNIKFEVSLEDLYNICCEHKSRKLDLSKLINKAQN